MASKNKPEANLASMGAHLAAQLGYPAAPVPPDQMLAQVQERIDVLMDREKTEEDIERGVAIAARAALASSSEEPRFKLDPFGALESKYVELFQEYQRRQRENTRDKQQLVKERDAAKTQNNKLAMEKKRLEELSRALSKERNIIREEHKKLESRVRDIEETQRNHLSSISALLPTPIPTLTNGSASSSTSTPAAASAQVATPSQAPTPTPTPPPAPAPMLSPDLLICVSSRYRAELWFKIGRTSKLSRLFNAWSERMEGSAEEETFQNEETTEQPPKKGGKKGKQHPLQQSTAAPARKVPKMKFMFTLYGKVVDPDSTPEELDLCDRDEMVAFELLDLTEKVTGGISMDHVQKLKKQWPVSMEDAKSTLEEMLEIVTRERLKNILRQYDLRETHWLSILKSKELELLLAKARLETANRRQIAGPLPVAAAESDVPGAFKDGIYQQESLAIFTSHTANLAKLATTLDDVENLAVYAVQESKNARSSHIDQAAILQQGFAAWRSNLYNVVDIAMEMNRRWGGAPIAWTRPVQKVAFDPAKVKAMTRQTDDAISDVD